MGRLALQIPVARLVPRQDFWVQIVQHVVGFAGANGEDSMAIAIGLLDHCYEQAGCRPPTLQEHVAFQQHVILAVAKGTWIRPMFLDAITLLICNRLDRVIGVVVDLNHVGPALASQAWRCGAFAAYATFLR